MPVKNRDYGECDCGGRLFPVWFLDEEEVVTREGWRYKTGRVRRAVSHLVCECCLANHCVDDSFDGPWK